MRAGGRTGKTYVPGFDDPAIIAGQGTMGLEILEDVPDLDAVIVPVGGGGLIAGVGTAVKALQPAVKVIGVEAEHAPTLRASLDAGRVDPRRRRSRRWPTGWPSRRSARCCFEIVRRVMDELVMVDEAQIATAVLRLLELEKTVVEGAGAVPLAAAMGPALKSLGLAGKKVVLCLCGGNIDVTLISRIIERGLAADGRLCRVVASAQRPPRLAGRVAARDRRHRGEREGGAARPQLRPRRRGPGRGVGGDGDARRRRTSRQVHEALAAAGIEVAG